MQLIGVAVVSLVEAVGITAPAWLGTAVTWGLTAAYLGFSVYSALSAKSGQEREGPRLGDLSVQSSARGAPLPRVWGKVRLSGNLIDGKKYEVEREEGGGGKKGKGGDSVTYYDYYGDFAITLCEGPIVKVLRIWLNNKLWYDKTNPLNLEGSQLVTDFFTVHTGTDYQSPDPTLSILHGADTPPYQGIAYIVFNKLPLLNYANAIPNVSVELYTKGKREPLGVGKYLLDDDHGGLEDTNCLQVPDTLQIWMPLFHGTGVQIFDADWNLIERIALPGNPQCDKIMPAYIPLTKEVWIAYSNVIQVYDSETFAYKKTINTGQIVGDNKILLFNPAKNQILLSDDFWGFSPMILDTSGSIIYHFGEIVWKEGGMIESIQYSANHDYLIVAGTFSLLVVEALTYTLAASFYDEDLTLIRSYAIASEQHDVIFWGNVNTDLHIINMQDLTKRSIPWGRPPDLGWTYIESEDWFFIRENSRDNNLSQYSTVSVLDNAWEEIAVYPSNSGELQTLLSSFICPILDTKHEWLQLGDAGLTPINPPIGPDNVYLWEIVRDLSLEAGLTDDDIDVTELTDIVYGYARAQPMEAAKAIEPLMIAYSFDAVESDWKLCFPKRKTAPDMILDEENLAAHEVGSDRGQALEITQLQDVELPLQTAVTYISPALDYQQGTQTFYREISESKNKIAQTLPICLSAEEAKAIAIRLTNLAWIEKTVLAFRTDYSALKLNPCDVVRITAYGGAYTARITSTSYGPPGLIEFRAVAIRSPYLSGDEPPGYSAIYDAPAANHDWPDDQNNAPVPVLPVPAETMAYLLNLPMLRDQDDSMGFYFALSPEGGNSWQGATLYKSLDGGESWTAIAQDANPAAVGTAASPLADGLSTIFDYGQSLTVTMSKGTLSSDTENNVLNWKNIAAYGAEGRWELIQWLNAELIAEKQYRLSGLLRGRLGTERAMKYHQAGDVFVALTPNTTKVIEESYSELGISRTFGSLTWGGLLETAHVYSFVDSAARLRPYSPVHLSGERNGDGNCSIAWIRRSRIDNVWRDSVEVALGELAEAYECNILSEDRAQVLRVFSVSQPPVDYTAEMQVQDFGSLQESIEITVYQISATVGRGNPAEGAV